MSLIKKARELKNILSNQHSSSEEINHSIAKYYDEIKETDDEEAVGKSMTYLSELFSFDNLEHGSTASLICGSLIENAYPAKYITDDYIQFFASGIKNSLPFIEACETELRKQNNDREEEQEYEIIERIKETLKPQFAKAINSLEGLDSYYQCGISIFSSDRSEFEKGKNHLAEVSKYTQYNSAFHWMSKLFEVLFDEPIIVLELNTKQGFKGKISGIVDNFQLQLLLMGLPELNDKINIQEEFLDVVKGLHVQQLEQSISGKWNMYNWEYLKNAKSQTSNNKGSEHWIWSEGIPDDISKFNGFRVILLDKPSYSRGLPIQRTFKNLKAEIKIEEKLDQNQVEELLKEMTNTN